MWHVNNLEGSAPQVLHMLTRCPTQILFRLISVFRIPPSFSFAGSNLAAKADMLLSRPLLLFFQFVSKHLRVQFESRN